MPGTFSPPTRVSDPDMHHGTCVSHVPWCMPGSLTSGFLENGWLGKRSRHSRRMRNPHFYVSVKRPIERTWVVEKYQYIHFNFHYRRPVYLKFPVSNIPAATILEKSIHTSWMLRNYLETEIRKISCTTFCAIANNQKLMDQYYHMRNVVPEADMKDTDTLLHIPQYLLDVITRSYPGYLLLGQHFS